MKLADSERLCLAQAIYHEARGESPEGQLAVANVIINRAMSKKYPIDHLRRGVPERRQGALQVPVHLRLRRPLRHGHRARSLEPLAEDWPTLAFHEFQQGDRPGVIPNSALFYHTTAVAPSWSHTFKRVASIGSHVFYATR